MELHEIEVIIEKDGQVRISVQGTKGSQCLDATKPLEDALGGEVVTRVLTAGVYEPEDRLLVRQHVRPAG